MMDPSYFPPLLDAAAFLDNGKLHDALLQTQSVYQQKLYFVAFIGQYSAGKSCLLNKLLKRRLLPEGTTETTPLLTYLRYGEREEAKLHFMDGTVQLLTLEQAARLAQQSEGWDFDRLEFLEVYLCEDMLRSGMILLDTPGINTLIERHERLLETSLSMAAGIVYVTGRAPDRVDVDKLTALTQAGFDISFVRTHCDEIQEREETLEQAKAASQASLAKCGIAPEQCYYVSNTEGSPLFAALDPLRAMLAQKGARANAELEAGIERLLFAQAEQCRLALERRRTLLEQAHANHTAALEKQQAQILDKIVRLESRLEETETAMRKRIESCRKTLQEDVKRQLAAALSRSGERIAANATVADEAGMTALLRREAAAFSQNAYQLIHASLDPLVQEINGEIPADELALEIFALPQAENYAELRAGQDELAAQLRDQLAALQKEQAALAQALAAKDGSPEFLQLRQELQELQAALSEIQQERAGLPPYTPQMLLVEDDRIQPSQIARSIGAAADWLLLLMPGAQIESALTKAAQLPQIQKSLGKFVGILEKAGKAAKQGDAIKDILFTLKNLSEHTRTSKRREQIAGEAAATLAKGAGAGIDALRSAKQNQGLGSVLELLTIEHWAGKLGAQFDRPPQLAVDREYEAQYREAKDKLEAAYRETQRKAYQKKLEMGLFAQEAEQLRAKEESLRIDQEAVAKDLAKRETELRTAAKQEAQKKWRQDCAIWYQDEVNRRLRDVIDSYTADFPLRLEEYQRQRLQALRDALENEQAAYNALKNAPADEVALQLQRVNELLECINHVFHK